MTNHKRAREIGPGFLRKANPMTREETVSLLVRLLPPAHPANQHNLQAALSEIIRTTSAAKLLALQYALEGMQKEKQKNE